jgi:hypothetical protein
MNDAFQVACPNHSIKKENRAFFEKLAKSAKRLILL